MPDFQTSKNPSDSNFYDLYEDYPLIEASFFQQYGIRLRETEDLTWDEFCTYLAGLDEKTPLGKIVAIRSEKDPKIVRDFTPEQKKIRNDWAKRDLNKYTKEQYMEMMKQMEQAFIKSFT